MHKVGNKVHASLDELFAMKTDERLFAQFVRLAKDWINAEAFKMQRRLWKSDISECRSWLTAGLWDAVCRLDERAKGVGIVFDLAIKHGNKVYVALYCTSAQRGEDKTVSHQKGKDGELEQIDIPVDAEDHGKDEAHSTILAILQEELSESEYQIVKSRMEGKTWEEIGEAMDCSRQYVNKVWNDRIQTKAARIYARAAEIAQ